VPFGAKIDFLPIPVQEKNPKFGPRAIPGVFLGYHVLPGGKWKGDILAASLEDFRRAAETPGTVVRVHRIKEMTLEHGAPIEFPFRAAHEKARVSLDLEIAAPPLTGPEDHLPDGGGSPLDQKETWDVPNVPERDVATEESRLEEPPEVVADTPAKPSLPPGVRRVAKGYMIHDRFVRDYKGSQRPPWIWPEIWKMMPIVQRDKAANEWQILRAQLEAEEEDQPLPAGWGTSSSSSRPAAACHSGGLENTPLDNGGGSSLDTSELDGVEMPTAPQSQGHRDIVPECELPFSAMVARPVGKAEIRTSPAAQQALQKEWDKLRRAECWDERMGGRR